MTSAKICLLHEEWEPCLKIGITLAIFKISGNNLCLSDKFMTCVSSWNISSADIQYCSKVSYQLRRLSCVTRIMSRLHTPCRTLQESHSLDCSSQHFYTVTTWYTVFPSTIVSDIHNGPRVGNLTQLSPLKGEKTWEWAMSVGKSKYALVGFQISWVVSPGFHKQNFPGFQIPLRGGEVSHIPIKLSDL